MSVENRQLVTNEPVEVVQDCRKITLPIIFEEFIEEYTPISQRKLEDVNMLPVGLANTQISTNYAQKSPRSTVLDQSSPKMCPDTGPAGRNVE